MIPKRIWVYWDNPNDMPPYIGICLATMRRNTKGWEFNLVTDENLFDWLPDMRKDLHKVVNAKRPGLSGRHTVVHQSNYIKASLLYKYGGIALDADTIVMPMWNGIEKYLNNRFLCRANENNYIAMNFLGSEKLGQIVETYLDMCDDMLTESYVIPSGSTFGARLMTEAYDREVGNPDEPGIDIFKKEVAPIVFKERHKFFNSEFTKNYIKEDAFCVMLYHRGFPKYFIEKSVDDIMAGPMLISQMFRRAMGR